MNSRTCLFGAPRPDRRLPNTVARPGLAAMRVFARLGRPARLQGKLVAKVTTHETEPLIEAMRIGPGLVRGELDEAATAAATLGDGPLEHGSAKSRSAMTCRDTHSLDLSAPGTIPREPGNEGQLQGTHDLVIILRHRQELVGIGFDRREGSAVGVRSRICRFLPLPTQGIVSEQGDDGRKIAGPRPAERDT